MSFENYTKTIGIIADDGILCHRLLTKLAEHEFPQIRLKILCIEPRTMRYGKVASIKTISMTVDNVTACDIIINLADDQYARQYAPDVLANNLKFIDLSDAFIDEIKLSIRDDILNLVACPTGFAIALHRYMSFIQRIIDVTNVNIAGYHGYINYQEGNELLDETKKVFFEPRVDGNVFEHQIAFNAFVNNDIYHAKCIKKTMSGLQYQYHGVNIPILNLEGMMLYMTCGDDLSKKVQSDISSAIGDSDFIALSHKGSMLEVSHEDRLYISNINYNNDVMSCFIYFDPFAQRIYELMRLLKVLA